MKKPIIKLSPEEQKRMEQDWKITQKIEPHFRELSFNGRMAVIGMMIDTVAEEKDWSKETVLQKIAEQP